MTDSDCGAKPKCPRRTALLSPQEHMAKFLGFITYGPPKPSAAALAQAAQRTSFEMMLSASAIHEANTQLRDPLRIRFDTGMDVDVTRPCEVTAFATAQDRCTLCDRGFCDKRQSEHAALCRQSGAACARDDSTAAESSDPSDSDSNLSDISVERRRAARRHVLYSYQFLAENTWCSLHEHARAVLCVWSVCTLYTAYHRRILGSSRLTGHASAGRAARGSRRWRSLSRCVWGVGRSK